MHLNTFTKKEVLVIRKESKDSETDQTDQRIIRCYSKWGQPAHIQMETWTPKLAAARYGTKKWAITVDRSFNTCPFTLHFTVHTPRLESKPNFSLIMNMMHLVSTPKSATQLQTQNQQHYKGILPDQKKKNWIWFGHSLTEVLGLASDHQPSGPLETSILSLTLSRAGTKCSQLNVSQSEGAFSGRQECLQ